MEQPRRKAISVRGTTYERMRSYAARKDMSISGVVEMLIAEHLDEVEVPAPAPSHMPREDDNIPARAAASSGDDSSPAPSKGRLDEIVSQHFTW